jgi:hypothetical protein
LVDDGAGHPWRSVPPPVATVPWSPRRRITYFRRCCVSTNSPKRILAPTMGGQWGCDRFISLVLCVVTLTGDWTAVPAPALGCGAARRDPGVGDGTRPLLRVLPFFELRDPQLWRTEDMTTSAQASPVTPALAHGGHDNISASFSCLPSSCVPPAQKSAWTR